MHNKDVLGKECSCGGNKVRQNIGRSEGSGHGDQISERVTSDCCARTMDKGHFCAFVKGEVSQFCNDPL